MAPCERRAAAARDGWHEEAIRPSCRSMKQCAESSAGAARTSFASGYTCYLA